MMSKKKLSEIKAEVIELLEKLPGKSPETWFAKEIEDARGNPKRDAHTLEMLCAALERETKKQTKRKPRQRTVKR
jgi:hypothetical protein